MSSFLTFKEMRDVPPLLWLADEEGQGATGKNQEDGGGNDAPPKQPMSARGVVIWRQTPTNAVPEMRARL